jgi:hypothetical protein
MAYTIKPATVGQNNGDKTHCSEAAGKFPTGFTISASSSQISLSTMYGLIAKVIAQGGKRDELTNSFIKGITNMLAHRRYIVAGEPFETEPLGGQGLL